MQVLQIKSLSDSLQLRFAARKSTAYDAVPPEQEAWCCRAYQIAEEMDGVPAFSQKRLKAGLGALRLLGRSWETIREIPDAIRALGIRFIIVEHLPRTKIDGAAFWLNKSSPVVVLSLRYARIDHFLFTLFHELNHVCHQDALSLDSNILDDSTGQKKPNCEMRANAQAAAFLVPPDRLARFIEATSGSPGKSDIIRFASEIQIHPGVVLGQLQHRSVMGWSACRELLVSVRELIIGAAATDGWGKKI
jgi:HTH-type transcriptional regulator/antitoxin HigA